MPPAKTSKPSGFKPLEIPKGDHTFTTFPFTTSPKPLGYQNPKEEREMNMLSIFGKKKSVQLLNAEEYEYNEIEERVRNSSIPRFEFSQIYKKGSFLARDNHHFKVLEFTTPATTGETDLLLVTPEEVAKAKQRNFKFMHIGVVQVRIKLLAREGLNCSVLCIL